MTVQSIKVRVQRRPSVKLKVLPRFPTDVLASSPMQIDRAGGAYQFSLDIDALSLGVLATKPITGTANEISVAHGDGFGGNPTISLPSALTFTGKTVTGGTFSSIASLSANVSNPALVGPLSSSYSPSADSGNKGALSIQTTWDSGNGGLNGASIVANTIVETTAGAVGDPGAIIAGTLVKGDIASLDPYGIVGIINNDTAVTSPLGAALWGITRGAKAGGTMDAIRATSESANGQHPRSGVVVYNSDTNNAFVKGVYVASATTHGVVVGNPDGTSVNDTFPTYPFAVWGKNLGTTLHDGLLLYNATPAAAGAQQASPIIHWAGAGWKTNAPAASQPLDWYAYLMPVQGAANPTSQLIFSSQVNAGGYSARVVMTSTTGLGLNAVPPAGASPGDLTVYRSAGTGAIYFGNSGAHYILQDGTNYSFDGAPLSIGSGGTGFAAFGTGVQAALQVAVGTDGAPVLRGGGLGTPLSGVLTNCSGLPVGGLSGLGTGVGAALAVAIGAVGAPVLNGGALGSPSSAGTMPAFTLGGNITGNSKNISDLGTLGVAGAGNFGSYVMAADGVRPASDGGADVGTSSLRFGTAYLNAITASGQAARTWEMARNVTPATAGQSLTIQAGGAVSGGTDLIGGNLILTAGISTGTGGTGGAGSAIVFAAAPSGQSSGTTDRAPVEVMRISNGIGGYGLLSFQGAATSGFNYAITGALGVGTTYFNGSSGINFRISNSDKLTLSSSVFNVALSTASTTSSNGALTVAGGAGVGGDVNVAGYVATGGNVSANGQVTSLTGTGYRAGAGGTVTQATSKATGVTLNKACGQITTPNDLLAANTTTSFTFTNSMIAATDLLDLAHVSGGTIGGYDLFAVCGSGSATVYIRNRTGGGLSEAIVIRFAVLKAATT